MLGHFVLSGTYVNNERNGTISYGQSLRTATKAFDRAARKTQVATALTATALLCLALPKPAIAHSITTTDCARHAQKVMINTPPHTPAVRRAAFKKCLQYREEHAQQHQLKGCRAKHRPKDWRARNACRIRVVWPHGTASAREAVRVAWCEGSLSPDASNGQYQGTFQMGSGERARWGHGPTVDQQAIAAAAYYKYDRDVLGRGGWGPWECKPGSSVQTSSWRRAPRAVQQYG